MRKTLHKVRISSINDPDTVYRGWAIGNDILAISDYGKKRLDIATLNLITTQYKVVVLNVLCHKFYVRGGAYYTQDAVCMSRKEIKAVLKSLKFKVELEDIINGS